LSYIELLHEADNRQLATFPNMFTRQLAGFVAFLFLFAILLGPSLCVFFRSNIYSISRFHLVKPVPDIKECLLFCLLTRLKIYYIYLNSLRPILLNSKKIISWLTNEDQGGKSFTQLRNLPSTGEPQPPQRMSTKSYGRLSSSSFLSLHYSGERS
jgi:hypothetical protein